ncbi:MAG TPA: methyltransferase domain-containing protein [Pyrinomonadaceae bacterium]
MIETGNSEINIEALKKRIRLAVQRREAEGQVSFARASAELFDLLARADFSPERWLEDSMPVTDLSSLVTALALQPEFVPQESYHVNDLLKYHDHQFVWNAYRALLKREPDEEGLSRHLQALRSGRANKIDILARLRYSVEGRRQDVPIEGLRFSSAVRRAYRLPVIGYLFEWVATAVRLPSLVHGQRQHEAYVIAQQDRIANQVNETQRTLQASMRNHFELVESLKTAIAEVTREQRQLARLQHQQLAAVMSKHSANGKPAVADSQDRSSSTEDQQREFDELYAAFQTRFRGEPPATRENLKAYLPVLEEAGIDADILDLGCGSGEWLEILQEAGLEARGVESNRAFTAEARRRHATVFEADATRYLRTLPDNSLSAITAFHFVEHLELNELIDLLKEVRRTLKPEGLIILETPNPKNLVVGACNFYSDPTHQRPLFPESLEFIVNHLGFEGTSIRYLHPVENSPFAGGDEAARALHSWFFGARDYAVIAYKPELR